MKRLQIPNPAPYFTREQLEKEPTENLLILLPENCQIFKDSGCWTIGHMDTDEMDFEHPTRHDYNIRDYLVGFLLAYPFDGSEIEVARWILRKMREPKPLAESL